MHAMHIEIHTVLHVCCYLLYVQDCSKHGWPLGYPSEANSVAFQNIYNNTNGIVYIYQLHSV